MEDKPKKYISKQAALLKARRFCAYQDRCHQEVRSKLLSLGIYGDDLEEILAALIADNFLNEERFARSFARGKFRFKGWGRQRIRQELKLRQISDYCIRMAMTEIEDAEYRETLRALLEKKAALLSAVDPFQRKQKLVDFALRRGFEADLVWEMLPGD